VPVVVKVEESEKSILGNKEEEEDGN